MESSRSDATSPATLLVNVDSVNVDSVNVDSVNVDSVNVD